jgi:hypothetical protein
LEHIGKLEHGHDGLIFTCAQTPYVLGTDEKMYVASRQTKPCETILTQQIKVEAGIGKLN